MLIIIHHRSRSSVFSFLVTLLLVCWSYACSNDSDCMLNGVCAASTASCVCDPGWGSSDCSQLRLGPMNPHDGRNKLSGNSSSWGGSAIYSPEDGLWHMFFARFEEGCGLTLWINNSVCVHATSASPLGPYLNESIALPLWCHGPKIARQHDGTFLLSHIGKAADPPSRMCDCASHNGRESTCILPPPPGHDAPADDRGYLTLATSRSLYGPWTPLGRSIISPEGPMEYWLSNPHIATRADGTLLLAYRSWGPSSSSESGGIAEYIFVASALNYSSEFVRILTQPVADGEDPFIFEDTHRNLHVLSHSGCGHGHSFAPASNISDWTVAPHAVGCNITWINGTQAVLYRRERPELLFNESKVPIVLLSAVEPLPIGITDGSFTSASPVIYE